MKCIKETVSCILCHPVSHNRDFKWSIFAQFKNKSPAEIAGSLCEFPPRTTMEDSIVLIGKTNARFNLHGQPHNYAIESLI